MTDAIRQSDPWRRAGEIARVSTALAHTERVRILIRLSHGEASVSAIQAALQVGQPMLSQNLVRLRHAGLVRSRRNGRWIHYSLTTMGADVLAGLHLAVGQGRDTAGDVAGRGAPGKLARRRAATCAPDPDAPAAWRCLARPFLAEARPRQSPLAE